MVIDLISNEAIALGLGSIFWGEFLSNFHQFNSGASLLMMKWSSSSGFSSNRFHNRLSCSVAYESFSAMMIGWAALSSHICLLCDLLVSSILRWAIEGFYSLRCWSPNRSISSIICITISSFLIIVVVMGWVWLRQMMTSRDVLCRTTSSRIYSLSLAWTISCWGKYSRLSQLYFGSGRWNICSSAISIFCRHPLSRGTSSTALVLRYEILKDAYVISWRRVLSIVLIMHCLI